jgi:proline dehydrogenase
MPPKGYDKEDDNPQLLSKNYYEQYEDNIETIRKVKNFVEGYYDNIKDMTTRLYMLRNDQEFYENSKRAYQQMYVK